MWGVKGDLYVPCPDPRFRVHLETGAPRVVLLRRRRKSSAAFGRQLLGDGAGVVRLEAAAAADVAHPEVVRSTGVVLYVPTRTDARLQRCVNVYTRRIQRANANHFK